MTHYESHEFGASQTSQCGLSVEAPVCRTFRRGESHDGTLRDFPAASVSVPAGGREKADPRGDTRQQSGLYGETSKTSGVADSAVFAVRWSDVECSRDAGLGTFSAKQEKACLRRQGQNRLRWNTVLIVWAGKNWPRYIGCWCPKSWAT